MKQVLIFETCDVSPHLETSLEIAMSYLVRGYHVDYIHVGRDMPSNPYFQKFCLKRRRFDKAAELIVGNNVEKGIRIVQELAKERGFNFERVSVNTKVDCGQTDIPSCQTLEDVYRLRFKNRDNIGICVAGSLQAFLGPFVRPSDEGDLIKSLCWDFKYSYEIASRVLKLKDDYYEEVVVFNGRFPWVAGAVQRFEEDALKVYYHERGANKDRYTCNSYKPSDRELRQKDCRLLWNDAARQSRDEIGSNFYIRQRAGASQGWNSFVNKQQIGCFTNMLEDSKLLQRQTTKVVSFFSSSENEYLAIKSDWNQEELASFEWSSQVEAVKSLAKVCSELGYQLVVRVHPNLQNKQESQRLYWDRLQFLGKSESTEGVLCIPSGSKVSTYEIIDHSDVVVTFGSTIGAEAVYWGKVSISLGLSFYDLTGITVHCAKDSKALKELLRNSALLGVDRSTSLPFGYYMSTYGNVYEWYQAESLFSGKFMGQSLRLSRADINPRRFIGRLRS